MVIALTVGLSVASKSITNLRTATDEASSQKAFSAAEAGVEQILKLKIDPGGSIAGSFSENSANYSAKITSEKLSGLEVSLNGGNPINQDDGTDVWLLDHNLDDNSINYNESSGWRKLQKDQDLYFYWGDKGAANCPNEPALELIVVTKDMGNNKPYELTRYAFDPCSGRITNNTSNYSKIDFDGGSTDGKTYPYKVKITIPKGDGKNKGVMVRVIPLYSGSYVGVKVPWPCNDNSPPNNTYCYLPIQGKRIESTGKVGETARKVVYYQGYPKLPSEFFQYVLFSR